MKYYWDLIRGKTAAKNPAKLTFRNIWAVIQAFFRKKRRNLGGFDLSDHIYEQIIYRRTQVLSKSPKCWVSGNCIQCGCEILGKTMEDRACENSPYCYPEMMSKDIWISYKKHNNIKLFE